MIAPVVGAGFLAALAAALGFVQGRPSMALLAGVAALLAASAAAEAFPVPVDGIAAGGVSLAAAFIVGAALIYDWQTATLVAALGRVTIELVQRRPLVKLAYNGSVYALAGAAAGVAAAVVGRHETVIAKLVAVTAASTAFYVVNVVLIAVVVARASGSSLRPVLVTSARWTAIPFAIMGSVSLMLAVLWAQSPFLSAALVGPLVAIALYQRSTHGALEAIRLANTDTVTGLGNHRAFHEALREEIATSVATGSPLTLCLIDVDEFKQINDQHGHQHGDLVLSQIGSRLRSNGEAFRLGGDEFALLLRGVDVRAGFGQSARLIERIGRRALESGDHVTLSAGLAVAPSDAVDADSLFAAADEALYAAKDGGRNQARVYSTELSELGATRREVRFASQLRAARTLASIVEDAGQRYGLCGGHADRVSDLAGRVAERLRVPSEEVELIRLAARLHDVGKLGVPPEVLMKTEALAQSDWHVLREHPATGRRILDAMEATPIAEWVLHHHESWDGTGYPNGLAGNQIPLASRIIFVADAFDAMTNDRPYRSARSEDEALAEIQRCAGSQFDPAVVSALCAEIASERPPVALVRPA